MKKILSLVFLIPLLSVQAQQLDIVNSTLSDQSLCTLTVETSTNILGRPSFTEKADEFLSDIIGPTLHYHDKGIALRFGPSSEGEILSMMTVYLTETWDEDHLEYYVPFVGELIYPADPNWKIADVTSYYSQYNPEVQMADQRNEAYQASGISEANVNEHAVYFLNSVGHGIIFLHEEVTSFLERFSFNC